MFGSPSPQSEYSYYKNELMKSSWEVKFAFFLDCSRIKWRYEYKRFYLGDTSYTPDFYLSEFNCWIEIKGHWRTNDKRRFRLFKKNW